MIGGSTNLIINQLQALSKKAIGLSGKNINAKLQGLCWSLGGCLVGLGLSWFAIFPRQLSLARGSDGLMLEWLSTPNGKLMRRSFASGNRSLEECIRKGIKKSGKAVCLLEIK